MIKEKKTIVCIEDELEWITLVEMFFKPRGFEIVGALGGREGLKTVRRLKPDLVLLDLTMPGMNGWEVYHSMQVDDELKGIPVIVVTSMSRHMDEFLAREVAKVDDYVRKPLRVEKPMGRDGMEELLQSVNRILGLDTVDSQAR